MIPGITASGLVAEAVTDPFWSFVKILVFGEGADGNQTFTDRSPVGRTLTANGDVQHDTGIDLEGQSILFDGTGDFISAADAADLSVGTSNDFCVEAYVRFATMSKIHTLANKRAATSAAEFSIYIQTSGQIDFNTFQSGNARLVASTAPGAVTDGVDYHIACTREGTTGRVFVNGVLLATATQSGSVGSNSQPFRIGRDGFSTARDFQGSLNWFRFTLGAARYTAAFTPPVTPFPTS
jgi:hypothetical protein